MNPEPNPEPVTAKPASAVAQGTAETTHRLSAAPEKIHICIRGFIEKRRIFENFYRVDDHESAEIIAGLGESHAQMMANGTLDMVEIEFLDEPNVNERFFRFGVNPSGMVRPIRIDLTSGDGSIPNDTQKSVPEEEEREAKDGH